MKIRARGFTLIELLVVIAIIGILASIVLVSLTSAQLKARDAKRLGDMKEMEVALEAYANVNGKYPATPVSSLLSNMNTGTADITPYISSLPDDPKYTGTSGYGYHPSVDRQSYSMRLKLERNGGTLYCSISGGTAAIGVTPGYASWNYSGGTNYPPCY